METKQNYSSIVHMNSGDGDKISISIMKELFYIILNKSKNTSDNNEFYLDIHEKAHEILDNTEKEEEINKDNKSNEKKKEKKR